MGARWSAIVFAVSAIALSSGAVAAERLSLEASPAKVGKYEKVEFRLQVPGQWANPFDPDEVAVSVRLTTPSGKAVEIPAFYDQEFERRQIPRGNKPVDWIYPVGQPVWKARFAPMEVGAYEAQAVLAGRAGSGQSTGAVRFECTDSKGPGFLRVSWKDPRYLEFTEGKPFFAIGQNLAFIGEAQYANLARAETMFARLGEHGANYLRVWVCCQDWATAIEAHKSAWGRSWAWRPPIVPLPGDQDAAQARECVLIDTRTVNVAPSHAVAVRGDTRYVISGKVRAEPDATLRVLVQGRTRVPAISTKGKTDWVPFRQEFTTGPDQRVLSQLQLQVEGGKVWVDGLSLREEGTGPELLWEADVNRPMPGSLNLLDCFVVDRILEAAERNGLYLQLCVITRDLYMKSLSKEDSPEYQEYIRHGKNLLRYAVARWGYSTHVAAWEYFNEMDPGKPCDRFYAECGKYLDEIDVYHHLRTTSTWSHKPRDWKHPQLDIAQSHHYMRPANGPKWKDEVSGVIEQARLVREKSDPNHPAMVAEFGLADDKWGLSPYMKQDQEMSHFHNALWASALSEVAGTAMFWWWEQLDQMDAYRHYRPLATFLADVPFTTAGLRPAEAAVRQAEARVVGLAGKDRAYLWLFNPQATWWNIVVDKLKPSAIQGATVEIQGLAPGDYQVDWWDTWEGKSLKQDRAAPADGVLRLSVPPFSRDVACKVVR